MTEPIEQPNTEEPTSRDPSNTPIDQLVEPLDEDDDIQEQIALVNSSRPEDLRGAGE